MILRRAQKITVLTGRQLAKTRFGSFKVGIKTLSCVRLGPTHVVFWQGICLVLFTCPGTSGKAEFKVY